MYPSILLIGKKLDNISPYKTSIFAVLPTRADWKLHTHKHWWIWFQDKQAYVEKNAFPFYNYSASSTWIRNYFDFANTTSELCNSNYPLLLWLNRKTILQFTFENILNHDDETKICCFTHTITKDSWNDIKSNTSIMFWVTKQESWS